MAADRDSQYRPISTQETGQGNPYTARFSRDLANGVNNYKAHFGHKLISYIWPSDAPIHSRVGGSSPPYDFSGLYVTEQVISILAPRYVPDGYTRMVVQAIDERLAGSGTTTWRIRAIHRLWGSLPSRWGLAAVLSSRSWSSAVLEAFGVSYTVEYGEWTTSSDSPAAAYTTFDCTVRDRLGRVFFLITAENSDADTYSRLWSLDVTPTVGA